jgi:hypothetical protein
MESFFKFPSIDHRYDYDDDNDDDTVQVVGLRYKKRQRGSREDESAG